jgi:chorismate mutase
MAEMAQSLDALRSEIDRIDDDLVRLLALRVEIGRKVAAAKGDARGPFLRPGREAYIMRRLIDQAWGDIPPSVVEGIWREILAANLARQVEPMTAVWDPTDAGTALAQARGRGASSTRIEQMDSAEAVIDAVISGRATLGVLPSMAETAWRWWPLLISDRAQKPRIIARLPFFGAGDEAVGIGAQDPDPSGDDLSFFAVPGEIANAMDTAAAADGTVWSLIRAEGFHAEHGADNAHIPAGAYPLGAHARPYSL